jgi:hypothetical protein
MSTSLTKALFWWLVLIILIQPTLSYIDYKIDNRIGNITYWAIEKMTADSNGQLTPEIKQQILDEFSLMNYSESDVEIITNVVTTERGNRLDLTIKAKRGQMFLYNLSGQATPDQYVHRASSMIETVRW